MAASYSSHVLPVWLIGKSMRERHGMISLKSNCAESPFPASKSVLSAFHSHGLASSQPRKLHRKLQLRDSHCRPNLFGLYLLAESPKV